ncbi:MAG: sigma-70 family RNA polymerase sigma factor [Bacillus sp. (in: Bacteria)]|nr:sigma-70 family RNA polymerase sigma factor [Bacillus sp. (in: firmicutes)]
MALSIARNVTIDYLRKKKPVSYYLDTYSTVASSEPSPEEVVEMGEEMKEVYEALWNLKKKYREVIILRKVKDFSIKETAEVLGWKETRVKTVLLRGLERLRTQLVKEGGLR